MEFKYFDCISQHVLIYVYSSYKTIFFVLPNVELPPKLASIRTYFSMFGLRKPKNKTLHCTAGCQVARRWAAGREVAQTIQCTLFSVRTTIKRNNMCARQLHSLSLPIPVIVNGFWFLYMLWSHFWWWWRTRRCQMARCH